MSDPDDTGEPVTEEPQPRRRWDPPRIETGPLFESNSLQCGNKTETDGCLIDPGPS